MFGVGISSDPWKLTSFHPCTENNMLCRAIVWELIANSSAAQVGCLEGLTRSQSTVQGHCKLSERSHKCIGKYSEVLSRQKLNLQPYNERSRKLLSYPVQFQYVFSLLLCAHQGDIRFRAKYFAPTDVQSWHSLFVFGPSQGYRLWWKVNLIFHKASHAEVGRCQIWW